MIHHGRKTRGELGNDALAGRMNPLDRVMRHDISLGAERSSNFDLGICAGLVNVAKRRDGLRQGVELFGKGISLQNGRGCGAVHGTDRRIQL